MKLFSNLLPVSLRPDGLWRSAVSAWRRPLTFILLAVGGYGQALGCAGEGPTHNSYLFSAFHRDLMKDRFIDITNRNWQAYMGLPEDGSFEYSWKKDEIREYARKKGDQDMLTYMKWLDIYLADNNIFGGWEYPSKEQLANRALHLRQMLSVAQNYKGRLRSQYGLLRMRAMFGLGKFDDCIKFWEQQASKYGETVYRQMMRNIYAGALVRSDRRHEGVEIYAEQQDFVSLKYFVKEQRNLAGIKNAVNQQYSQALINYLVQDFVNNAQETIDALKANYAQTKPLGYNSEFEKDLRLYDVRAVYMEDIDGFMTFARQQVGLSRTRDKALWWGALGTLEYLLGRYDQAIVDLEQAMNDQHSDQRLLDNARAVSALAYMHSRKSDSEKLQLAASNLAWLDEKAAEDCRQEGNCANHYSDVKDRLVYQELVPMLDAMGRSEVATALLGGFTDELNYRDDYFDRMWGMQPEELERYVDWLYKGENSSLMGYARKHVKLNASYYYDLVGTRYLAQAQFEDAIKWLEKVKDMNFLSQQAIAGYTVRDYNVDRWMEKQKLSNDVEWTPITLTSNKKLAYCKDILREKAALNMMKQGMERYKQAYKLASLYYQASYEGDCWWLTQYGVSMYQKEPLKGTFDFVKQALDLLDEAAVTWINELKFSAKEQKKLAALRETDPYHLFMEKALYARAYIRRNPWGAWEWNGSELVWVVNKNSRQYDALVDLHDYFVHNQRNTSMYIHRCDVLKRFDQLLE